MAYNNTNKANDEIIFRVISKIGVLAEYQTGWTKEVNIVSWNEGTPKIDIRDWNPEHTRLTKGITLYEEEAKKLAELLSERFNIDKESNSSPKQEVSANESLANSGNTANESLANLGNTASENLSDSVNTEGDGDETSSNKENETLLDEKGTPTEEASA